MHDRHRTRASPSAGWRHIGIRNRKLNAHSTATWSGQYFDDGDERILTHWLLTLNTAPSTVWKSTNVGHVTFTRNKPGAAEIAKARALTVGSPHPEDDLQRYEPHARSDP